MNSIFSFFSGIQGPVPWLDILGVFLFIAGFIIGLGAVTVIDIHGVLGRKSPYWTETTIRTHKVTKPMIWFGLIFATIGALITYRNIGFTGVVPLQALIGIVLVLNGSFLSFYVSPFLLKRERDGRERELIPESLQIKLIISGMLSFIGWWGEVFLFTWYLVVIK
jgi:hypothetical protein